MSVALESGRPRTTLELASESELNIADRLRGLARVRPYATAIVEPRGHGPDGRRAYAQLTFAQLDGLVDTYARGFAGLGIRPGMRVLSMVKPSLDFFAVSFALFRLGAVPVLIDPAMGKHAVLGAIGEVEPEAFVAIPKGHVARILFGKAFRSVRINVTVGKKMPFGGTTLAEVANIGRSAEPFKGAVTRAQDLASILFTSGSTGAPKGVLYTHAIFDAQVRIFQDDFGIEPGEVDLSAFPLFSLFSCALGVKVVIPDMDATRPAFVDGRKIVEAIEDQGVSYAFGSPAFWRRIAEHCEAERVQLKSLRRVLMAGAPAPPALLERLSRIVPEGADVYTPYGATECLPITLPSARSLLGGTVAATERGAGTCVGHPIADSQIAILPIDDGPIARLSDVTALPAGQIGEIAVHSKVTTPGYFRRPADEARHKMSDGDRIWHRMGDLGYQDAEGRLWFCGRKSHRVETERGPLYTECVEPIFNTHPRVFRSALVGLGARGRQRPVLIVECEPHQRPARGADSDKLIAELLGLARPHEALSGIRDVLFHPAFPVDARHNAKIKRELLALWAAEKLGA